MKKTSTPPLLRKHAGRIESDRSGAVWTGAVRKPTQQTQSYLKWWEKSVAFVSALSCTAQEHNAARRAELRQTLVDQ